MAAQLNIFTKTNKSLLVTDKIKESFTTKNLGYTQTTRQSQSTLQRLKEQIQLS